MLDKGGGTSLKRNRTFIRFNVQEFRLRLPYPNFTPVFCTS